MLKRRTVLTTAALATVPLALPHALAQGRKDSVVLAMTLEPPGLDPTAGAASAIAEITQYNIYETLTKINSDGTVTPAAGRELGGVARPAHLHLQAAQAA